MYIAVVMVESSLANATRLGVLLVPIPNLRSRGMS
jgi:hypothetical protein